MKEIQKNILRPVDVTKEYKCLGKMMGAGLMGTIVPVRGLVGLNKGKVLICKMVEHKEEGWEDIIKNEISVLMLNEGDSLIKCHDSYTWYGKSWIILEKMGSDIRKLIALFKEHELPLSENFIKFVLYRTL